MVTRRCVWIVGSLLGGGLCCCWCVCVCVCVFKEGRGARIVREQACMGRGLNVWLRLQAVDHPYLVVYSATAPGAAAASSVEQAPQHVAGICDICHDPMEDPVTAACGHPFCRLCIREYLESNPASCTCPTCSAPLTVDLTASTPQVSLAFGQVF
jgi:Zinc finger, C3HC4 type (RING finger)